MLCISSVPHLPTVSCFSVGFRHRKELQFPPGIQGPSLPFFHAYSHFEPQRMKQVLKDVWKRKSSPLKKPAKPTNPSLHPWRYSKPSWTQSWPAVAAPAPQWVKSFFLISNLNLMSGLNGDVTSFHTYWVVVTCRGMWLVCTFDWLPPFVSVY